MQRRRSTVESLLLKLILLPKGRELNSLLVYYVNRTVAMEIGVKFVISLLCESQIVPIVARNPDPEVEIIDCLYGRDY